tara:strand:+ start:5522 stop:6376 length:855 start_codon:yes stop_codon:yes gene_type:complete
MAKKKKSRIKNNHNKKRNTAFLFETLVRELSTTVVSGNEKRKQIIINVIKEHFAKDTVLGKELSLYRQLYETHNMPKEDAEKLLTEVQRAYTGLVTKNAFAAQSQLIKKVNKDISPKVFSNFVPSYKAIATVAQIFDDRTTVKNRVILERRLINQMSSPKGDTELKSPAVNGATIQIFAKKFNETYGHLHEEQKILLSKYINSATDNGLGLKVFLNEEIGRLKEELSKAKNIEEIRTDTNMLEKTNKVVEALDSFKGQFMTEEILQKVLKIQDLVREITADADS